MCGVMRLHDASKPRPQDRDNDLFQFEQNSSYVDRRDVEHLFLAMASIIDFFSAFDAIGCLNIG